MRSGFSIVPLRRIARVQNGGTPGPHESNWEGDVPWATPVDLGRVHGGYLQATERSITATGLQSGSTLAPAGSVLISSRAPIGYAAIAGMDTAFNQGCKALIPLPGVSQARFLKYAVESQMSTLQAAGRGSTFTEVSASDVASLPVPVTSLAKQDRIADYLDRETAEIDASIAELSHFIKLTEERRNATRIKLFSPPYTENLTPIKRVAQLVGGSGFPLAQQGLTNEELPFYKVGSLSSAEDGTLTMAADSISRLTARSLGAEVLPPGSVVMAKIGAALFLRRNALLTKPGCIDNNMLGLIPTSEIDGRYLQEVLLTLDLTPIANPGAVPSLNMRWFRETKIEAPSLETQRKVMRRFSEVDSAARLALVDATKAIQLAQERRSALISAAVTGLIDVAAQGMSAAEQLQDELEVPL